jgi:DNA polymerase-1
MQFDILSTVNGVVRKDLKCTACSFHNNSKLQTNCMSGVGPTPAEIMFVGVNPGVEDDGIGKPMLETSPNGRLFHEILKLAGINPDETFITNFVKCSSYEANTTDKHAKACKPHLLREIERVKPKVIVAVGAQAVTWLTGQSGIKRLRRHALPCLWNPKLPIVPMQQPATIFHVPFREQEFVKEQIASDLVWLRGKLCSDALTMDDDPTDYRTAKTIDDVKAFLAEAEAAEDVAADLECSSLSARTGQYVAAFGISFGKGISRIIPLVCPGIHNITYWTPQELEVIKKLIYDFMLNKKVFGHNFIQFDQKWFRFWFGLDKANVDFDTFLCHYLVDEERGTHNLEHIALNFTNMKPWKKTFTIQDVGKMAYYLSCDVDATWQLKHILLSKLTTKQRWLLDSLLVPLSKELMEMEWRGVQVSRKAIKAVEEEIDRKRENILSTMKENTPEITTFELEENETFNVNSPEHVSKVMEVYLNLPCIKRTEKGQYSTDKEVLEVLEDDSQFVADVHKIRQLEKLKGTYCVGLADSLDEHDVAHTSYSLAGTVTGRPNSSNPNLSNMPRASTAGAVLDDGKVIKSVFTAREGYVFIQLDFSQIELRILAILCCDPELMKMFLQGLDVHRATAARVYGVSLDAVTDAQRNAAKIINFGIVYGMTLEALVKKFVQAVIQNARKAKRRPTREEIEAAGFEAQKFATLHRETFPGIYTWLGEQERIIRRQRYQETYFGRQRRYQVIDNSSIRQGYNFPVQSLANDCMLFALNRLCKIFKHLKMNAYPLLTVYDSVVIEAMKEIAWEAAAIANDTMENLGFEWLTIPLKVDAEMGESWGSVKKIDIAKREFVKK